MFWNYGVEAFLVISRQVSMPIYLLDGCLLSAPYDQVIETQQWIADWDDTRKSQIWISKTQGKRDSLFTYIWKDCQFSGSYLIKLKQIIRFKQKLII